MRRGMSQPGWAGRHIPSIYSRLPVPPTKIPLKSNGSWVFWVSEGGDNVRVHWQAIGHSKARTAQPKGCSWVSPLGRQLNWNLFDHTSWPVLATTETGFYDAKHLLSVPYDLTWAGAERVRGESRKFVHEVRGQRRSRCSG